MRSSGEEASGESYEEHGNYPIEDQAWERAARMLEELKKARYRQNTEEAIAKGFSSWEEMKNDHLESSRRLEKEHEKYMEEKARSLGITVDELYDQDPQRDRSTPYLTQSPPAQCDCDGWCQFIELNDILMIVTDHPIPFFCPRSLVLYQSQDAPGLREHLNNQHRLNPDELSIKQGDKSRRFSQGSLEMFWTRKSQKYSQWPFWTNNDQTLRQIIVQSLPRFREDLSQSSVFTEDMSQGAQAARRSQISSPELDIQQPGLNSTKLEHGGEGKGQRWATED